jgi:nitrate/nitrite transporter NarK
MMTVFASAVGPLLLAMTLESTGSYDSIFYVLAAAVVVLGIGCWYVSLPSRRPELAPGRVAAGGAKA